MTGITILKITRTVRIRPCDFLVDNLMVPNLTEHGLLDQESLGHWS